MDVLLWTAVAAAVVAPVALRAAGRVAHVRAAVLEEVRRALRFGVIEDLPERGPQVRGRLGELEVTVDLLEDPERPAQSPRWRVLAVGPVSLERPLEARVGGWQGWIDPWLQLGETLSLSANHKSGFTLHSEHPVAADHPVVLALQRQGASLGRGALHARQDLMRAEVQFRPRVEDNQTLFAYLHAMAEISERPSARLVQDLVVGRLLEIPEPVFETLATRLGSHAHSPAALVAAGRDETLATR